ncbi:hypothetical protein MMC11_003128 [Xylographa trunciseda]|nr:hypothetical protein [Xylographa trunciseda]
MQYTYFIVTPQLGRGSIQQTGTLPGQQLYCVKFGDTDNPAVHRTAYQNCNPTWSFTINNVAGAQVGGVNVGTWLKNSVFEAQHYSVVNRIDGDPDSEWYQAWNLNMANVAGLVNGGFTGYNLQTVAGRGLALPALLAIFTANNRTPT